MAEGLSTDPSVEDLPSEPVAEETKCAVDDTASATADVERRFVDGKWMCEDGSGGYLEYNGDSWVPAEGENLTQKWLKGKASCDPYRCVVDGVTMEWNDTCKQWFPVVDVDEDFLAKYHASYGINYDFGQNASSAETKEAGTTRAEAVPEQKTPEKAQKSKAPHSSKNDGWVDLDESRIASVYVTNLPKTITEESFIELMSKCGVIQRNARTNKLKVKIYKDEDGVPKGDATCGYIKKESVDLALQILDGWVVEGNKIGVEKARFEMKGEFDPSKKRKRLTAAEKKRFIGSQEKIFEWKPEKPRNYRPFSDCTIVMKNMFTQEQMMRNAALMLDLEEGTRKVCERFGVVKKVVVHDNNPEGVICVTFENVEYSDMAVRALNGRIVDGRTISVALWDGRTKYAVQETEEQREQRLAYWKKFISEND